MKYIIAHRGNIDGPKPSCENTIPHIERALLFGFDVEIDVWGVYESDSLNLYLGHDEPSHKVSSKWLENHKTRLWCHAKNLYALQWLNSHGFHCFFHDKDEYTLTSKQIIWAYPTSLITKDTIYVMPENDSKFRSVFAIPECLGVCTDYAIDFVRNKIEYIWTSTL